MFPPDVVHQDEQRSSGRCSSGLLLPVPGLEPRNLRDGNVEGRRDMVLLREGRVRRGSPFHPGTERPRQLPGRLRFMLQCIGRIKMY